ncbi:alpha-E domain-containing protein [Ramlibacter sp. H39-3-26]|nr:alpha-E domain-containing protein [Ramlibacter sp. H39-3-26]MDF1485743.1 alpha-E domain-containing protein [Ramlibacter sp. H39-3-26]
MLSRTADHLFWMSRYTERAEKRAAGVLSIKHDRARSACGV